MISRRRLRRFYSSNTLPDTGKSVCLAPGEARHLGKIIRLVPGDECLVTDGGGREARATVLEFRADGSCLLRVEELFEFSEPGSAVKVRIFAPLLRSQKLDFLVEKCQELGVSEMIPVRTSRTVARIDAKKISSKLQRWHKIAAEASKQSGEPFQLHVGEPAEFSKAVESALAQGPTAIFHPADSAPLFPDWLDSLQQRRIDGAPAPLNLFIGPEGGFSKEEIKTARTKAEMSVHGLELVSLGTHILKADTAVIGVAASLLFLFSKNGPGDRTQEPEHDQR